MDRAARRGAYCEEKWAVFDCVGEGMGVAQEYGDGMQLVGLRSRVMTSDWWDSGLG